MPNFAKENKLNKRNGKEISAYNTKRNKSATAYTTTSLQQAIDVGLPLPPITGATYSLFSEIQSP
jgi:hypothetical protein